MPTCSLFSNNDFVIAPWDFHPAFTCVEARRRRHRRLPARRQAHRPHRRPRCRHHRRRHLRLPCHRRRRHPRRRHHHRRRRWMANRRYVRRTALAASAPAMATRLQSCRTASRGHTFWRRGGTGSRIPSTRSAPGPHSSYLARRCRGISPLSAYVCASRSGRSFVNKRPRRPRPRRPRPHLGDIRAVSSVISISSLMRWRPSCSSRS